MLIQTEVGKREEVAAEIGKIEHPNVQVVLSDATDGPYDVVVRLEGGMVDELGKFVFDKIQSIESITRTVTEFVTNLALDSSSRVLT